MAKKSEVLPSSGVDMSPNAEWRKNTVESPGLDFNASNPDSVSKTTQSDRDGSDLNKIFEKYEKGGMISDPIVGDRPPMYGDFSTVGDFTEQMREVTRLQQNFEQLPARLRNRFNNDVKELIEFVADPKNDAELVKMGLKKEVAEPKAPKPEPPAQDPPAPAPAKS